MLFIQNNAIQESIGIANLSAILRANGHETDLLLISHTPDVIEAIEKHDPGLIAFFALIRVHHSFEQLVVFIKKQLHPDDRRGPHPTYSPEIDLAVGHTQVVERDEAPEVIPVNGSISRLGRKRCGFA